MWIKGRLWPSAALPSVITLLQVEPTPTSCGLQALVYKHLHTILDSPALLFLKRLQYNGTQHLSGIHKFKSSADFVSVQDDQICACSLVGDHDLIRKQSTCSMSIM